MFNKTLINKPATSSIKEAALSSSLRTVIIFVRTIESFMFHGAMAFRADQRELHSSCNAPHSAFASASLMALRRLVAGRAVPMLKTCSICGFVPSVTSPFVNNAFFQMCAQDHERFHLPNKQLTRSGCASENYEFRALRNTLPTKHATNYRTFPSGICKRTFPSKGCWGWESVCWLVIGITFRYAPKEFQMALDGTRWPQTVSHCPRWLQIAKDGSR